jgi:hypothetical protein
MIEGEKNMDIIIEKLYRIKEKPVMYIGKKSITHLRVFMAGYIHRELERNVNFKSIYFEFDDFISEDYRTPPNVSWDRILTAYSSTDDTAFDLFYCYLDKFLHSRNINLNNLKKSKKANNNKERKRCEIDLIIKRLYAIKEDPIIYIGGKSVILVRTYLDGYTDRILEVDSEFKSIYFEFYSFVRGYYKMAPNHHWDRILTAYSRTDEEAFALFYEYLNKFLEEKKIKIDSL